MEIKKNYMFKDCSAAVESGPSAFESLLVRRNSDATTLTTSSQCSATEISESMVKKMKVNRYVRDPERLQLQLIELAFKDELTGLHNRRGFQILAKRHFRLARTKQRGLLMFFADVDGLKQINDQFGHHEGDQALIRTATAIKKTFRKSDVTARLSGDEFVALVLEESEHNAAAISSRLESNLARYAIKETRYRLSLSVGVARIDPQAASSLQALIAQADTELYAKKRNRLKGGASESFDGERVKKFGSAIDGSLFWDDLGAVVSNKVVDEINR